MKSFYTHLANLVYKVMLESTILEKEIQEQLTVFFYQVSSNTWI